MSDAEIELIRNGEVSEVADWFKGRCVLVTGATGFLGKVLVERILKCCPAERLYLLLRPKKGKDVKERLEDFLNCQIFDCLRDNFPERLSRVVAIKGDVLQEGLGMSAEDTAELQKHCRVVFHCAANVRFDQKLKGAVTTNTLGTKKVLHLAKGMLNLDSFVHVSTSYCHCNREVLEEISYAAPHDPEKIIDLVNWMDEDIQELITPKLLGGLPNTYAYSKSLSEQLVASCSKDFPIVIARPSIVIASWKAPMPGWIENLNGPTGLLVGAGKGVIRSMHCKETYHADIMPVDICANALIALAWKSGITRSKEATVCNVTASGVNPITWGEALSLGRKHLYKNPFSITLWYPDGSIKASWLLHFISVVFFHFLPAYFIDMMLVIFRNKPFMVKTQKRISGGLEVLQYYTTKEWIFNNETFKAIGSWLGPKDRQVLFTDISGVNWDTYMKNYILGAREYCCKDDPATLPRARQLLKKLYLLDQLSSAFFYGLSIWILWTFSTTIFHLAESTLSSSGVLFGIDTEDRVIHSS